MERLILKEFGRRFYDYFPYEWHWDGGYAARELMAPQGAAGGICEDETEVAVGVGRGDGENLHASGCCGHFQLAGRCGRTVGGYIEGVNSGAFALRLVSTQIRSHALVRDACHFNATIDGSIDFGTSVNQFRALFQSGKGRVGQCAVGIARSNQLGMILHVQEF